MPINNIDKKYSRWTTSQGQHLSNKTLKSYLYELQEPMTKHYIFGVLSGDIPEPSVNTHILFIFGQHDYIYNRLQEAPTTNSQEHQLRYSFTDTNFVIPKQDAHIVLIKDHLLGKSFVLSAPQSKITVSCNVLSALHTLSTVPKDMFKTSIQNIRNLSQLIKKND